MNTKRTLLVFVVIAAVLTIAIVIANSSGAKREARELGGDIKDLGHDAKEGVKDAGEKTKEVVEDGVKKVKDAVK